MGSVLPLTPFLLLSDLQPCSPDPYGSLFYSVSCFHLLTFAYSWFMIAYDISPSPNQPYGFSDLSGCTQNRIHHLEVYNSVTFSISVILCNHHFCLVDRKYFPYPRRKRVPSNSHFVFPLSPIPWKPLPHFPSLDLPTPDISCKCSHTKCDILCLAFHLVLCF